MWNIRSRKPPKARHFCICMVCWHIRPNPFCTLWCLKRVTCLSFGPMHLHYKEPWFSLGSICKFGHPSVQSFRKCLCCSTREYILMQESQYKVFFVLNGNTEHLWVPSHRNVTCTHAQKSLTRLLLLSSLHFFTYRKLKSHYLLVWCISMPTKAWISTAKCLFVLKQHLMFNAKELATVNELRMQRET